MIHGSPRDLNGLPCKKLANERAIVAAESNRAIPAGGFMLQRPADLKGGP